MTQTADAGRTRIDAGPEIVDKPDDLRIETGGGLVVRTPSASARVLRPGPPEQTTRLTVVVPTRNEEENVGPLLAELGPLLVGLGAEILVVDDSDDETPAVLAREAAACQVPVRLLHREPGRRRGGLSSAVVAGARQAAGEWVLVMDADLQHPPADAARLARTAMWHDADIVIGTRYAGAGSGEGLDGRGRTLVSTAAGRVSRLAFPRRLATVTDPMSGLFAFRRDAIDLDRLHAVGFKLLLEILVRHPRARVAEVSYTFAPRTAGRSKADLRQGLTFVRHLTRLRRDVLARQLRERPATAQERLRQALRAVAFGLVGLSGVFVNTAVLWFFYQRVGLHAAWGATLATQASTLWNFLLVDLVVYRGPKRGTRRGRAVRFFLMNNLLLMGRMPIFLVLVATDEPVLVANAMTLVLLFLVRFFLSDRVIYGATAADSPTAGGGAAGPAVAGTGGTGATRDPVRTLVDRGSAGETSVRRRSQYLTYRYDVAGIVTIGSQIKLPELEFFRAQWVADADVDIAVRVGDVGRRTPRPRALMTQYVENGPQDSPAGAGPVTLRYEEHLGRFGANFRVELADTVTVTVGPLLARSPHVVYTNVVEALLRFVMVDRGHMLLHSATISLDGVGVMLSALTDTGKTATVLRLLREHGGRFLSDDMTIVAADGTAVCFPKPLTISAHTLRAVQADDLSGREWRRLQWQSRLHSKGGRSIALTLSRFNLPIMGINALTQILVPPPKYSVDRLVPTRIGSSTRIEELFVIERGTPRLAELDREDTLRRMLANTDDAYGFPPFKYFAPAVTIGGRGYRELRAREEEILRGFLSRIRARVLASDSFGWADAIPELLRRERGNGVRGSSEHVRPEVVTLPDDESRLAGQSASPSRHALEAWPRWGAGAPSGTT
jgi:dolichol-phosphate mannosyltransferase